MLQRREGISLHQAQNEIVCTTDTSPAMGRGKGVVAAGLVSRHHQHIREHQGEPASSKTPEG